MFSPLQQNNFFVSQLLIRFPTPQSLAQCLAGRAHCDFHAVKSCSHFCVHIRLSLSSIFDMLGLGRALNFFLSASVRQHSPVLPHRPLLLNSFSWLPLLFLCFWECLISSCSAHAGIFSLGFKCYNFLCQWFPEPPLSTWKSAWHYRFNMAKTKFLMSTTCETFHSSFFLTLVISPATESQSFFSNWRNTVGAIT